MLHRAIEQELVASVHGIYKGGLGVHLAMVAMGGDLGMAIELSRVAAEGIDRDDVVLFSESAGRFIITIDPAQQAPFEKLFDGLALQCIGTVTDDKVLTLDGFGRNTLLSVPVDELKASWQKPFGDLS